MGGICLVADSEYQVPGTALSLLRRHPADVVLLTSI
jgi:hypothetical protein